MREEPDSTTLQILLVEDKEDDYLLVRDLLHESRTAPYTLHWLKTYEEGLAALQTNHYAIALAEYRLPEKNGVELLQNARSTGSQTPFVLLTNKSDYDIDMAAMRAGATDYLVKDQLSAEMLERVIRYSIEHSNREAVLQAALLKSDLLSAAVSNISDGVLITDPNQNDNPIIFANAAFCSITGYSAQEILGRNCRFLQGAESNPETIAKIRLALRERHPFSGVLLNYRKDGTPFWNGLKITPVFDGKGQLVNFVGLTSDVTERRNADLALREIQARKAAMLESAIDGIVTIDQDYRILEFNPAAERIFGYSRNAALGRDISELIIPPAQRQRYRQQIAHCVATGEWDLLEQIIETRRLRADGSEFPAEIAISRIERNGPPIFTSYVRDITERKRSEELLRMGEERFRMLSHATNDAIWDWDLENETLWWSEGFKILFGYQAHEIEPGIESWESRLHREDCEWVIHSIDTALKSDHPSWAAEYRFKRADGSYAEIFDRGFIIRNDAGRPVRMVGSMQDITERKQTEHELRVRDQFQSTLLNNFPNGTISVLDHNLRYVLVAGRGLAQMQRSSEELIGKNLEEAFNSEQVDIICPAYKRVLAGETVYFEVPVSDYLFSVCAVPLHNEEGLISNIVSVAQDVTQRKRAEESLRQANELLKSIMEGTTDAIFAKDLTGRYLMMNTPGAHFMGYEPEQIIGKNDIELFPAREAHKFQESDRSIIEGGSSWTQEEQVTIGNSTRTYLTTKGPLRGSNGDIVGIVGIARNITERKQTELALQHRAEFETLIANISTSFIDLRSEDVDRGINHALQIIGTFIQSDRAYVCLYSPDGECVSNTHEWHLESIASRQEETQNLRLADYPWYAKHVRAQQTMHVPFVKDLPAEAKNERAIFEHLMVQSFVLVPMLYRGQPIGHLGFESVLQPQTWTEDDITLLRMVGEMFVHALEGKKVEDELLLSNERLEERVRRRTVQLEEANSFLQTEVSERKQAQREAQRAREEAERANHAKSEFLSRMSHELRTPLNAIIGFGQILEMDDLPPKRRESVEYILKAGRHLLSLINEVMDISRIESGKLSISLEPVPVAQAVREVLGLVQSLTVPDGVQVVNEVSPANECYIWADRQRLLQVLLNLTSNAIKYNVTSGQVFVSSQLAERSDVLRISIRDTGRGLSEEDLKKLFTPFERLGAAKTRIQGTGIGLVLSKRLIETMGGGIGVESQLGEGSTFWIELGLAPNPIEEAQKSLENEALILPIIAHKRILYIEDNLPNLQLVELLLKEQTQMELLKAMQGQTGLSLALRYRPDLILLDLHLPDMAGDEVLTQLKANPETAHIPVIIVSADTTQRQIERLLSAGAKEYITKPLNVKHFLALLDATLGSGQ